jgi:hypothetical protein
MLTSVSGAESVEILQLCKDKGVQVVQACVLKELPRAAVPKL